jgi:hypothetical protein
VLYPIFVTTVLDKTMYTPAQLKQEEDAELNDDTKDIDPDTIMELNRAARVAEEDEDNEDDYDVTGLRVIADVKLAKTIGA